MNALHPQTATQVTLILKDANDKAFLLQCISMCQKLATDKNGEPVLNIPVDANTSGLIASILSRASVNPHGMNEDMASHIRLDTSNEPVITSIHGM